MDLIRVSQTFGMNMIAETSEPNRMKPKTIFLRLLSQRKTLMATTASNAPRDWLPSTATRDSSAAPPSPHLINLRLTVEPR